jgi:cyclopropane-fatty-acyl-phospholipid synthase
MESAYRDKSSRAMIVKWLEGSGITLDGREPWDPQIHDERVLKNIIGGGSLALGEGYMQCAWSVSDLCEFIRRALCAGLDQKLYGMNVRDILHVAGCVMINRQRRAFSAAQVARDHYDIEPEFYAAMLDPLMIYTCGYWKDADTLAQAQQAKLDLVARKLVLKEGQRVLDIGCGWGGSLIHLANNYGVTGVGVTNSQEQARFARKRIAEAGLTAQLEIICCDYRLIQKGGAYDAIFSLGMFEHVGPRNYKTFMHVMHGHLKPGGLCLLHTICASTTQLTQDAWFNKYIFPNSHLPSVAQIFSAADSMFVLRDGHNFGPDYARTLHAWCENFKTAWPELSRDYGHRMNGNFYRMWEYYLCYSEAGFRAGYLQLCQFVFSGREYRGEYTSVR